MNLMGSMGMNLKSLLMVAPDAPINVKNASSVTSYDYNALMEIGKNAASRQRPMYLEPEYDFISKNDPHPRWDPERWHAGTKAQHMKSRKDSMVKENGAPATAGPKGTLDALIKGGQDGNWRKKDKRSSLVIDEGEPNEPKPDTEGEFRLGPQRRSYKEGCKPQNTRDEPLKRDSQPSSGRTETGTGWREQRKQRDNDRGWRRGGDDEDKFRDFRNDDSRNNDDGRRSGNRGFTNDRFDSGSRTNHGNNNRYNDRGRYGRHHHEEDEPEWMNEGPASHLDFMELGGFDDDHRGDGSVMDRRKEKAERQQQQQQQEQNRPRNSDSPELVAFDVSAFGGSDEPTKDSDGLLGGTLESGGGDGLDSELTDINGLLGSIGHDILDGDDDDLDGGNSRFTKFFNTIEKPDSPKKESPPMPNLQRMDPSAIWNGSDPMMQPPMHRQMRQGAPQMPPNRAPGNQGIPGIPAALLQGNQGIPVALLQGAPTSQLPVNRAFINPAQPMRLEELEGRGGPSPISPHDNQPPPDIQMKLLNLSKQREKFEAKNNIQRMMNLGGQKPTQEEQQQRQRQQQQQQQQQQQAHLALQSVQNPFPMPGAPRGRGAAPPFLDSRSLEMPQNPIQQLQRKQPEIIPQQPHVQSHEKRNIYRYLNNERKSRKLTPSEDKFIDKYQQEMEIQLLIDQNLNFGRPVADHQRMEPSFPGGLSLERQKQLFEQKLSHQSGLEQQRGGGQNGPSGGQEPAQKAPAFMNQFTPTSVMRKMVRTREDGTNGAERPSHRSQKITPLEYTGVTRVPKSGQTNQSEAARKLSGGNGGQGQSIVKAAQQVGMRTLPGAPQVNFPPAMMMRPGQPIANIPNQQMMFQQLIMRQQIAQGAQRQQQQQPPPPQPLQSDPFLHQRKQQSARMTVEPKTTPTDENIHIHKLLTPNRPRQFPDFG